MFYPRENHRVDVELRLGDSHYGNELGSIFIALSTGRE